MAEFLGIIPARYASSRFPGKPLALLGKKPMIQWVYEGVSSLLSHLVVATDDHRIKEAVEDFGGRVLMTSPDHRSGTERCSEAYRIYREQQGIPFSHVINIQGDEPLLNHEQLKILMQCASEEGVQIATLIKPLLTKKELDNPNVVKVVVDEAFRALYFSRSPIPYIRDPKKEMTDKDFAFYSHIGLYAFQSDILEQVAGLGPTSLERAESLEQLRWMEHGFRIQTRITLHSSLGVDTPEDLEMIRSRI